MSIKLVKEPKKAAMSLVELKMLQALPLDIKIAKTKARIKDAVNEFGWDGIYVPVSGGKDSMVLSNIVEQYQKEEGIEKSRVPRVNGNTGLELDDVLALARELSDLEVRPIIPPYQVWKEEGYPIGSKKTSMMIQRLQNPTGKNQNTLNLYMTGIKMDGSKTKGRSMLGNKWKLFIDSEVKISHKCCDILKKDPMKKYEEETGRIPLLGVMAAEGGTRVDGYLKTGCNAFHLGKSLPIGFWTEQDILQYILEKDLKIAKSYGKIIKDKDGKLTTTLEKRTGCYACPFGVQLEDKKNNRFHKLKKNDYRKWKFAMLGGEIDHWGNWVPKRGLGMGHILEMVGIDYGKDTEFEGQISIEEVLNKKFNVGDKFKNLGNGIITEIIDTPNNDVILTQKLDGQLVKNIRLTQDWIEQLIANKTIEKII